MTHSRAVFLMVLVTLMWSIAGVVTRHLQGAESFEVTFWRSAFTLLALSIALSTMRGAAWWRDVLRARWPLWVSGLCWAVMFTAFMIAITLTTVANVLVTLAVGPLVTALFARVVLQHRLPHRTWVAIGTAGRRGQLDLAAAHRARQRRPRRAGAGHAARRVDRRRAVGARHVAAGLA